MLALLYSIIAVVLVLAVALLVRRAASRTGPEPEAWGVLLSLSDSRALRLAERLFDSSDYHWLRDHCGSPALAQALAQHRQELALCWLKELRLCFAEIVRMPDDSPAPTGGTLQSWRLLWQAFRFHGLLLYVGFVVRVFGPYAPLVPSTVGLRSLFDFTFRETRVRVDSYRRPA